MGPLNTGSSIYHEIQALYWRSLEGKLLAIEGKASQEVEKVWPYVRKVLESHPSNRTKLVLPSGGQVETVELDLSHFEDGDDRAAFQSAISKLSKASEDATIRIQELHRPSEDRIIGTLSIIPASDQRAPEFRDWAISFILSETRFLPHRHLGDARVENAKAREHAQRITDIFEEKLQNVAPNDQWISGGGRSHFEDRVYGFTERHACVEFCLPAFPCKSSNKQKTIGSCPDKAENIALNSLRTFLQGVAAIYEPGAKVIIISDGHVFSDCIGVDDAEVDVYGGELEEMGQKVVRATEKRVDIDFLSLWDIFFANPDLADRFANGLVDDIELPHALETSLTDEAELCRKTLMAMCQVDPDVLSKQIKGEDEASLALYRGFSRFMLEDLAEHPSCEGKSGRQRKKLATKVAGEMIKRNQAYSNLAELLFPSHLRLSIHAHDNRGPKFGICLFPRDKIRPIESLDDRNEPQTQDLLHIPTPWHNSIIEVEGDPTLYLAKSHVAQEALNKKDFAGASTKAGLSTNGDRFLLHEMGDHPTESGTNSRMPIMHTEPVNVS